MKRLLILLAALCLHAMADAQGITISVTYSPAAQARAGLAGTNVADKIDAALATINGVYSTNGITTVWSAYSSTALKPPPDSASADLQFNYVLNSYYPWVARGSSTDASISVYVYDAPGVGTARIATTQPADAKTSVIAIPYQAIDLALEAALSKILGSTNGYGQRMRSYPTDPPPLAGQNYCYRTRETAAWDMSIPLPYLPYWVVYAPGSGANPVQQTESATQYTSCQAYLAWWWANGHTDHTAYATAVVVSGNYCEIHNTSGTSTGGGPLVYFSNPGSQVITCSDNVIGYSKNAAMTVAPFLPLGTIATDSVSAMNARWSIVRGFSSLNSSIAALKKPGWFSGFFGRN